VRVLVTGWSSFQDPFDTRLDGRDWRLARTPDQLESIIKRLDVVVTSRMHGLVLALKNGVPALAVGPIAEGAKVSAQAAAWSWPAVMGANTLTDADLDHWWGWCRSTQGQAHAGRCGRDASRGTLIALLLKFITEI
jgi:hypothetical protein